VNVFVKTTGRTFNTDHITHAMIVREELTVFPVDYHQVTLTGDDKNKMVAALRSAGFVGTEVLINPNRISVIEDHAENVRVYLEGADRVLYMPANFLKIEFPAPETPVINIPAPAEEAPKPRPPFKKKASE
jgi:hypothetical protein